MADFSACSRRGPKKTYDPDFIEKLAHVCNTPEESIFRILYYDCSLYEGTVKLPVSGNSHTFKASDAWLHALSHKDLFAVRRVCLNFGVTGRRKRRWPLLP